MGDRNRKVVKTCQKMSLLFGVGQDRRAVRILKEQEISPALLFRKCQNKSTNIFLITLTI